MKGRPRVTTEYETYGKMFGPYRLVSRYVRSTLIFAARDSRTGAIVEEYGEGSLRAENKIRDLMNRS